MHTTLNRPYELLKDHITICARLVAVEFLNTGALRGTPKNAGTPVLQHRCAPYRIALIRRQTIVQVQVPFKATSI